MCGASAGLMCVLLLTSGAGQGREVMLIDESVLLTEAFKGLTTIFKDQAKQDQVAAKLQDLQAKGSLILVPDFTLEKGE